MGGFEYLVRAKGLEPSTSTLARLRSSQLSYARTAWHILTYTLLECKYYFQKKRPMWGVRFISQPFPRLQGL